MFPPGSTTIINNVPFRRKQNVIQDLVAAAGNAVLFLPKLSIHFWILSWHNILILTSSSYLILL